MSPFFSAVAELAVSRGFEVAGVNEGALTLNLNGEFAAMVDETGAMNYHPYKEVLGKLYEKYVPQAVREYIDSRGNVPPAIQKTNRSTARGSANTGAVAAE